MRDIFESFVKTASATQVVKDCKKKGYQSKARRSRRGNYYPSKPITKSSLYQILNNKLYIGKIEHKEKGKTYEGLHEAIIDMKLWNQTQSILKGNSKRKISLSAGDRPYLLKGILYDPDGYSLTPSMTKKKNKKYRYYVSTKAVKRGYSECELKTISAPLLEDIILDQAKRALTNIEWVSHIQSADCNLNRTDIKTALKHFDEIWDELFPAEQARIVQIVIRKIQVYPHKLVIEFNPPEMMSILHEFMPEITIDENAKPTMHDPMILEIPVDFKKRHKRRIITAPDGSDLINGNDTNIDDALVKAIVRAHKWQGMLDQNEIKSMAKLADEKGLPKSYVSNVMRLTDLAPDITAAIINGRQPQSLQLNDLMKKTIPLNWDEQRQMLGFTA